MTDGDDAKRRTLRELHEFERLKADASRSFDQKIARFAEALGSAEAAVLFPLLSELDGDARSRRAGTFEGDTKRRVEMAQRDIDVRINDVPDEGGADYLVSIREGAVAVRRLGPSSDADAAYLKPMQKKADDEAYLKPMQKKPDDEAYLKPMQKKPDDEAYLKPMQKKPEELSMEMLSRRIEDLRDRVFSQPHLEQRNVRRLQELAAPDQARPNFAVSWSSCESQSCHPG